MTKEYFYSKAEQLEQIKDLVELAITQTAEITGLRNFYIWMLFSQLKEGHLLKNEDGAMEAVGELLEDAFNQLIKQHPHGAEFMETDWYKDCATTYGNNLRTLEEIAESDSAYDSG